MKPAEVEEIRETSKRISELMNWSRRNDTSR